MDDPACAAAAAATPALDDPLADSDPNPAALAGALELAEEAHVFDLAGALADPGRGDLVSALLCHELAACHRLMSGSSSTGAATTTITAATAPDPARSPQRVVRRATLQAVRPRHRSGAAGSRTAIPRATIWPHRAAGRRRGPAAPAASGP
jgi:hypothetical protein